MAKCWRCNGVIRHKYMFAKMIRFPILIIGKGFESAELPMVCSKCMESFKGWISAEWKKKNFL
jgi:hypothetical protein